MIALVSVLIACHLLASVPQLDRLHHVGVDAAAQDNEPPELVAAIYDGDCDEPILSSKHAISEVANERGASEDQLARSFATSLSTPLGDFLAEPHAVIVDVRTDDLATPFGCVTIADIEPGERILADLTHVETGQMIGIAVVSPTDDGGTSVVIFLVLSSAGLPLEGNDLPGNHDTSLDTETVDDADLSDGVLDTMVDDDLDLLGGDEPATAGLIDMVELRGGEPGDESLFASADVREASIGSMMRAFAQPAGTTPDIDEGSRLVYFLEGGDYRVTEVVAPEGCELVAPFETTIASGETTTIEVAHQCETHDDTDDGGADDDGRDKHEGDGGRTDDHAGGTDKDDDGKVTSLPETGQGGAEDSSDAALVIASMSMILLLAAAGIYVRTRFTASGS